MSLKKVLLMLSCVIAFAMFASTPASAQRVVLASRMGAKCLDAEGGRSAAGTRLIGYACSGQANQQFEFMNDGTIRQNGMCVDASGGRGQDGDQIVLWNCNGGANQRWRLDNQRLVGANGKCIDLKGGQGWWFGNQPAILFTCNGQTNQGWIKGVVVPSNRVKGITPTQTGSLANLNPVNTNANVIAAGGANVIAAGGGNVIAAGGGNVIAAGGGNVIAAGGGNMIVLAK